MTLTVKTVKSIVQAYYGSAFLCGHDLLNFVRNFSVRFLQGSLEKGQKYFCH